jgi:ParB-like chromosome segregation protein Spo0J
MAKKTTRPIKRSRKESTAKDKGLTIEFIDADALKPSPRNARTHSERQIEQIEASITEFGFVNPVLIDEERNIVAGHGRIIAAKRLGIAKVPCLVVSGLTKEQIRAYVIADNKIALNSGWDEEMLKLEMKDLEGIGIDLGIMGFSKMEIDELMATEAVIVKAEEIIHQQSLQVEPAKEYLLIVAEDATEWDAMIKYFKLQQVRRGGYRKGSPFDAVGLERVLKFDRVKNANRRSK